MGNTPSRGELLTVDRAQGHHECDIFGRGLEAAESAARWKHCEKNPGHKKFIPVLDFKVEHLPQLLGATQRIRLRKGLDRTVRLRVQWTSVDRPEDDDLTEYRGTDRLRLGTGYIGESGETKYNEVCPCKTCAGRVVQQYYIFFVVTALHVVFNSEEAQETKVDLFYDDENSYRDGRMKTVWAVKVEASDPQADICKILCVTHGQPGIIRDPVENPRPWDQDSLLIDPPKSPSLSDNFKLLGIGNHDYVMIISHPHGQPKKVTIGKRIGRQVLDEDFYLEYETATCPGSSGAPVFLIYSDNSSTELSLYLAHPRRASVHSGTYKKTSSLFTGRINYSNHLHGWSFN